MSTPIYKNEQAWRAIMLLEQSRTRTEIIALEEIAVGLFILYLMATYSVPAALCMAVLLFAFVVWRQHEITAGRKRMLEALQADHDLDL